MAYRLAWRPWHHVDPLWSAGFPRRCGMPCRPMPWLEARYRAWSLRSQSGLACLALSEKRRVTGKAVPP